MRRTARVGHARLTSLTLPTYRMTSMVYGPNPYSGRNCSIPARNSSASRQSRHWKVACHWLTLEAYELFEPSRLFASLRTADLNCSYVTVHLPLPLPR